MRLPQPRFFTWLQRFPNVAAVRMAAELSVFIAVEVNISWRSYQVLRGANRVSRPSVVQD